MVENPYPRLVLRIFRITDHTVTGCIDQNTFTITNFVLAIGYCSICRLFKNNSCSGVKKTGMFTFINEGESLNSIHGYLTKNNTPCSKAKILG